MDLSKLNTAELSESGVEMQLRHLVTGELLDAWITLCGQDSKVYRQKRRELRSKSMQAKVADAVELSEQHAMEVRVACTLGWRGLDEGNKPIKFSQEKALEIYTDPGYQWIVDQVDRFIGDRANFLPKA